MKTLLDVKRGMAKDQVIAGLADRFVLEREDVGGLEWWTAHPKKPGEEDAGVVVFDNGKVSVVRIPMTPVLSGDAIRLARELFFMLQAHAKPPADATKVEWFLNLKRTNIPVEVQTESMPTEDTQMMRFDLGDVQIEVDIQHKPGQPDEVRVVSLH
jgi:hypothetical protein